LQAHQIIPTTVFLCAEQKRSINVARECAWLNEKHKNVARMKAYTEADCEARDGRGIVFELNKGLSQDSFTFLE
jgi:hypothetical protein